MDISEPPTTDARRLTDTRVARRGYGKQTRLVGCWLTVRRPSRWCARPRCLPRLAPCQTGFYPGANSSSSFPTVHQILHCNLRVADHRLARALKQAGVSASCPCDGGFHRLPAWLGNAGQQDLGQAVHECEQSLLSSSEAEDFPPDLLDAGRESFFRTYEFLAATRQFLFHPNGG